MALGATGVLVSGYVGYKTAENSLTDAVMRQLTGVRRAKAQQIEAYFHTLRSHVRTLSEDRMFIDATTQFKQAYRKLDAMPLPPGLRDSLQNYYRPGIPARTREVRFPSAERVVPAGRERAFLCAAALHRRQSLSYRPQEGTRCGRGFERLQPRPRQVSPVLPQHRGQLRLLRHVPDRPRNRQHLYTVDKEPDFGTSLTTGPYRNTGLARIVKQASRDRRLGGVVPRRLRGLRAISRSARRIYCQPHLRWPQAGRHFGLSTFERRVRQVTSGNRGWVRDGLGQSGDSGIVGADYLLRSNARGFLENPDRHLALMRAREVPGADHRAHQGLPVDLPAPAGRSCRR